MPGCSYMASVFTRPKSLAYEPVGESAGNVKIKRLLDELYLRDPCLGSQRLVTVLERVPTAHQHP